MEWSTERWKEEIVYASNKKECVCWKPALPEKVSFLGKLTSKQIKAVILFAIELESKISQFSFEYFTDTGELKHNSFTCGPWKGASKNI